jgi:hypothetical protein
MAAAVLGANAFVPDPAGVSRKANPVHEPGQAVTVAISLLDDLAVA